MNDAWVPSVRRSQRLNIRTWAWIALLFSAILPGIPMLTAISKVPADE